MMKNATPAQRMLQRDLKVSMAIADERRASILKSQASMKADADLCSALLREAMRRGQSEINWPEYFRNVGFGL